MYQHLLDSLTDRCETPNYLGFCNSKWSPLDSILQHAPSYFAPLKPKQRLHKRRSADRAALESKRVLNVSEASLYSGYSRGMIEHWIREGLLPYEAPRGQGKGCYKPKFIRRKDLDVFLERYYHLERQKTACGQKQEHQIVQSRITLLPKHLRGKRR